MSATCGVCCFPHTLYTHVLCSPPALNPAPPPHMQVCRSLLTYGEALLRPHTRTSPSPRIKCACSPPPPLWRGCGLPQQAHLPHAFSFGLSPPRTLQVLPYGKALVCREVRTPHPSCLPPTHTAGAPLRKGAGLPRRAQRGNAQLQVQAGECLRAFWDYPPLLGFHMHIIADVTYYSRGYTVCYNTHRRYLGQRARPHPGGHRDRRQG